MRFLAHQRIFKRNITPQGNIMTYSQTALSRDLLSRGDNSMAAFILLESSPPMLAPWQHVWSYTAGNPGHSQLINEAMACDARIAMQAIIAGCDPGMFDGRVLHDWSDDECIQILQKCKESIPSDKGKVIIFEAVVGETIDHDKLEHVRLMLDMVMMAHTSKGKERTFKEWEQVIHRAGFSRFVVKPIHAVQSIIEAYP